MIHLLHDGEFVPLPSKFCLALNYYEQNGDEDAKQGVIKNGRFGGQFDSCQVRVNPVHCGKGQKSRSDGGKASAQRCDSPEHKISPPWRLVQKA
jgi:hypothetical protein